MSTPTIELTKEDAPASVALVAAPQRREILVVSDNIPMLDTARFEHMQRVATVMAETSMIPDSLRMVKANGQDVELPRHRVIANCFMVVNQSVRWGMDPFAVAQCCSVVYGRLMYEGKLVAAVLDANLGVRLQYDFDEKPGRDLGVTVSGTIPGETVARTINGRVKDWHKGDKSPWGNEGAWKRQLRYMGAREWARAHAPAIMLGVIADDESDDQMRAPQRAPLRNRAAAALAVAADIPEDVAPAAQIKTAVVHTEAPRAQSADDTLPPDDDDNGTPIDGGPVLVELERRLTGCSSKAAFRVEHEMREQLMMVDDESRGLAIEMIQAAKARV